jgi:hypothetical protein
VIGNRLNVRKLGQSNYHLTFSDPYKETERRAANLFYYVLRPHFYRLFSLYLPFFTSLSLFPSSSSIFSHISPSLSFFKFIFYIYFFSFSSSSSFLPSLFLFSSSTSSSLFLLSFFSFFSSMSLYPSFSPTCPGPQIVHAWFETLTFYLGLLQMTVNYLEPINT